MAKGIKKQLVHAIKSVGRDIKGHSDRGGLYAAGLACEGYAGGYRDALTDVLKILDGLTPSCRPTYWEGENCCVCKSSKFDKKWKRLLSGEVVCSKACYLKYAFGNYI
jgi:hypothetical protein